MNLCSTSIEENFAYSEDCVLSHRGAVHQIGDCGHSTL